MTLFPELHHGDIINTQASKLDQLSHGGIDTGRVIHYGAYFALTVIALDRNLDSATITVRKIEGIEDAE